MQKGFTAPDQIRDQDPCKDAGVAAGFGVDKLGAQAGRSFVQSCPGGVVEDGQNAAYAEAVKNPVLFPLGEERHNLHCSAA